MSISSRGQSNDALRVTRYALNGNGSLATIGEQPMKRSSLALATTFLGAAIALPSTVLAPPPPYLDMLHRKSEEAQKKLREAEQAKGSERQQLIQEHMEMMDSIMRKMGDIKPAKDMSMQEHEELIAAQRELLDQLLGQMMKEHHMLLEIAK